MVPHAFHRVALGIFISCCVTTTSQSESGYITYICFNGVYLKSTHVKGFILFYLLFKKKKVALFSSGKRFELSRLGNGQSESVGGIFIHS